VFLSPNTSLGACSLLTEASNWITQELAKCDTTQAILNIQRRIVGGDSLNLVKEQRSLILEGEVQCQTYTQEGGSSPTKAYTLFLFSDSILVTRGKGGRKAKPTDLLRVVEHLPLDQVETLFDTVGQRTEFDPARYFCFSSRNRVRYALVSQHWRPLTHSLTLSLVLDRQIYHCLAPDKDLKAQWLDMIRQQIRQMTKFRGTELHMMHTRCRRSFTHRLHGAFVQCSASSSPRSWSERSAATAFPPSWSSASSTLRACLSTRVSRPRESSACRPTKPRWPPCVTTLTRVRCCALSSWVHDGPVLIPSSTTCNSRPQPV